MKKYLTARVFCALCLCLSMLLPASAVFVTAAPPVLTAEAETRDYLASDQDIPLSAPAPDDMVRAAYQKIYEGMVTLERTISLHAFRLNKQQLKNLFQEVVKQPEFFYVDSRYQFTCQYTGEVVSISPVYTMRGETLVKAQKEYSRKLDEILARVSDSWTDFEKILFLHDDLAVRFFYDEEAGNYDAYSFLMNGSGVCQSYALTLQALLTSLGIPNYRVVSEAMNHTWTLVQIDGAWYHMDVTWDDPVPDQFGQVMHRHFLHSDTSMQKNGYHGWSAPEGVVCSDTRFDNAFWSRTDEKKSHAVRTPFVPYSDGLWYYIDNFSGGLFAWNPRTGKQKQVTQLTERWTTKEGVFRSLYTGLIRCGDKLLFNGPHAVYAYHPVTKTTETVLSYDGPGLICGIRLDADAFRPESQSYTVSYITRTSPGDAEGIVRQHQFHAAGTFTLSGAVTGYFADAPAKISLYRNGTMTASASTARAKTYLEEELPFTVRGIRPGVYDLVIEARGYFPYVIKGLSVTKDLDLRTVSDSVFSAPRPACGDFNADGRIDDADRALLCAPETFCRSVSEAKTPAADLNGDGRIDIADLSILTDAKQYGRTRDSFVFRAAPVS